MGDSFHLTLPCLLAPGFPGREGNSHLPSLIPGEVLCSPSPLRFPCGLAPCCRNVLHPLLFSSCLAFSVLQKLSPAKVHFSFPSKVHTQEFLTKPQVTAAVVRKAGSLATVLQEVKSVFSAEHVHQTENK